MACEVRRRGARGVACIQGAVLKVLRSHPGFRLLKCELGIWADLVRAFRGISVVANGETAIRAKRGLWFVPGMVPAATVVEILAVELLLPWPPVTIVLAVGSATHLVPVETQAPATSHGGPNVGRRPRGRDQRDPLRRREVTKSASSWENECVRRIRRASCPSEVR